MDVKKATYDPHCPYQSFYCVQVKGLRYLGKTNSIMKTGVDPDILSLIPIKSFLGLLDTWLWWVGLYTHGLLFSSGSKGLALVRFPVKKKKKKKKKTIMKMGLRLVYVIELGT